VGQFDLGTFAAGRLAIPANLTISAGLRWETQTNIRVITIWLHASRSRGAGARRRTRRQKTVIRTGWGIFMTGSGDRLSFQAFAVQRYSPTELSADETNFP